jgi:hypothetical protein
VAPGAYCSVKVRFQPAVGATGAREGTLNVEDATADTLASVALDGTATGTSSTLKVAPGAFDFGTVAVGAASGRQKFVARNIAGGPGTISGVDLAGADPGQFAITADTCTGVTVAAGATCFVRARFKPASAGAQAAEVAFMVGGTPVASAQLSGTGAVVPGVRIAPAVFSFGEVVVGEQSPNQKWTVKNTGGATIHVASVELEGGDVAQFQRNRSTCAGAELAPGEYCTVKVRFRPSGDPGLRAAQLVVDSDVPGTHAADLGGIAVGV